MWSEVGSWPSVVADALQRKLRSAGSSRGVSASHAAIVVGLALTLAACSSIDSMLGDEPPPPTARTSGGAAPAQSGAPADNKDYPRLSTVPERPQRPTPPPQQGLAADRSGARYADNEVRPVNEAADAVVGQRLAASAPRSNAAPAAGAAPGPASESAPPAAAPAMPVQSTPPTPMQQPTPPQSATQPSVDVPAPSASAQAAPAQAAPVQAAPVQAAPVQSAPVQPAAPAAAAAPVAAAPAAAPAAAAMPPAPAAAPVATTLPPPPAPSQQALILPPTTRPPVSAVTSGRAPASTQAPVSYGNNIQVAVVQFGRASSGLSSDDLAVLRDVAEIQKKQGGVVRVVGHASQDSSGSDVQRLQEGNYAVSLARANAIANQLVRFGVPRNAIVAEAAGDRQPEYDPVTEVAVASNRRAEIFLAF